MTSSAFRKKAGAAGRSLPPYRASLAGTLLAAREAVMSPIRPILRDAGLTEQQWRVLRVLADEGPCEASRLARFALLHAPSVTRILKELVDRGLISRLPDPNDGRRTFLTIAPDGRRLVNQTAVHTAAVLGTYRTQFGERRLAALQDELVALTELINGLAGGRDDNDA